MNGELLSSVEVPMNPLLFVALVGYLVATRINQSAVVGEILLVVGPRAVHLHRVRRDGRAPGRDLPALHHRLRVPPARYREPPRRRGGETVPGVRLPHSPGGRFLYTMSAELIGLSGIVGAFIAGVSVPQVIVDAIFFVPPGVIVDGHQLTPAAVVIVGVLTLVTIATGWPGAASRPSSPGSHGTNRS